MYVCVCNAITERQVRSSVEAGATTLADLQFDLGVATCCGSCADHACSYLPEGAKACQPAYEVSMLETEVVVEANGETAIAVEVDAIITRATTRRFPVHVVAQAA